MRRLAAGGILLGLALSCARGTPNRTTMRLAECEGVSLNGNLWQCGSVWTFTGNVGKAQWPNHATANLTLERFDNEQVIILRTDTGISLGATAVYTGKRNGHRIEGQVVYTWPAKWSEPKKGRFAATIDDLNEAKPRAAGATARLRGPLPDISGVWQLKKDVHTDPKNFSTIDSYLAKRAQHDSLGGPNTDPAVAFVQDGADVTMVVILGGRPRFVSYRGRFESRTLISGHSCDLSPSKDDPYCLLETVTAVVLDSSHLKDSTGNDMEKVAGREDPRFSQALTLVPAKGAKPYLPRQPFDLTGTWQYEVQRGPIGRIEIAQKDGLVDMWGPFGGYPYFTGWYLHNPVIAGTAMSRASKGDDLRWTASTVFIDAPDQIRISMEGVTAALFRLTPPAARDIPCDDQNRFHVARAFAWIRGRVAFANKDERSARCWATISANQGYAPGQSLLAALLIRGAPGMPPDYAAAFQLASKSAAQGDTGGQLVLASLYREGKGTAPDAGKAQFWDAQAKRSKEFARWQALTGDITVMSTADLAWRTINAVSDAWDAPDNTCEKDYTGVVRCH